MIKEPGISVEKTPSSRLRGSLVRHFADTALHKTIELTSHPDDAVISLGIPGLEGTAVSQEAILSGNATLFENARLSGLWHYSNDRINTFSESKADNSSGKFGKGTYFGAGDLKGETVDLLKAGDTIRHEVVFEGNIVVIERTNVTNVANELKQQQGLPISRLKTNIQTAPLTELFAHFDSNEKAVDGVLIVMDPEHTSAELAVLPQATSQITVYTTDH